MPPEIKRCFLGCCRFVDNRPVAKPEYEKAFQNQEEILIPCRAIPAGDLEKSVEAEAGFYIGTPLIRGYGTLLPTGRLPFLYHHVTGERLRQATNDDLRKWNEVRNRLVTEANSKPK